MEIGLSRIKAQKELERILDADVGVLNEPHVHVDKKIIGGGYVRDLIRSLEGFLEDCRYDPNAGYEVKDGCYIYLNGDRYLTGDELESYKKGLFSE